MKSTLTVSSIQFADGSRMTLASDAIVVITGPNNSGKSTFLDEITRTFRRYGAVSEELVVKSVSKTVSGSPADAFDFLGSKLRLSKDGELIPSTGSHLKRATVEQWWANNELSKYLENEFVEVVDPRARLGAHHYNDRDPVEAAADQLFFDEETELQISSVIKTAFGVDLILNRARDRGSFHVGSRSKIPSHRKRLTKEFRQIMRDMPLVTSQGAGMRSFARIALQLLTSWRSVFVIDEPELFLHPPQVRHLARLIAKDADSSSQVFIATHSEAFVKGILDSNSSRVVVIRLQRLAKGSRVSILKPADIKNLWEDPLFRTSNVMSGLFHDVSVLVEGESDALFLQSIMATTSYGRRIPDAEYFSCNGKSKMPQLATALRSVNVPTIAIVDIDIMQRKADIVRLYEAFGGRKEKIESDVDKVIKGVESEKNIISGKVFLSELQTITDEVGASRPVLESTLNKIRDLMRRVSPWIRIKQDGMSGIVGAETFNAAKRIIAECRQVGILINPEGELENFCRSIPRANKGEWLNEVLKKNVATDEDLRSAREFASVLEEALKSVASH